MTHNEIYTKFMIEYDKANVSSSYPSLTKYEAATLLDRAYLALISRKLTGNNTRRVPFEYDTKAIEDLRPLVTTKRFKQKGGSNIVLNEYKFGMPDDLLYYIEGVANYGSEREIVLPVNHQIARKFKLTNSNIPWVNHPVSYIEGSEVYVLIDPFLHTSSPDLDGTYIKKPASFVESLKKIEDGNNGGNNSEGNDNGGDNNGGGNDSGGDNGGGNSGGDDQTTVTPPTFLPENSTFEDHVDVELSATPGDRITYIINGVEHNYTNKIHITDTTTISAYAIRIDETGSHRSSTVSKKYTKQLGQLPQNSPSVSILESYYRLDVQNVSERVYVLYTVSKGEFDGDLFIDLEILGTHGAILKVKNKEKVTNFNSAISCSTDNFRYTDKFVILTLYDKSSNKLGEYTKSISNMPSNIPSVTILECKYIPADGNTPERIKIVHSIDFKNSNIPVDRFIHVANASSARTGEKTFNIKLNVSNEEIYVSYNSGDSYVSIILNSAISEVLCNKVSKTINNLPSNAPEAPDPEEGFDYDPSAPSLEEETSNVLGEATLGEIILQ